MGRTMTIRIILADDHQMFREALEQALTAGGDIELVGEASDGQEAVTMAKELSPDILVMDIGMPRLNGIEATDVYEGDRVTSVLIRLPEKYRSDERAIKDLLVDAPSGERIPLSELAQISRSKGPQTIFRENLMRRKILPSLPTLSWL